MCACLVFKKSFQSVQSQWSMWGRGDELNAVERNYYIFKTFDPSMRKQLNQETQQFIKCLFLQKKMPGCLICMLSKKFGEINEALCFLGIIPFGKSQGKPSLLFLICDIKCRRSLHSTTRTPYKIITNDGRKLRNVLVDPNQINKSNLKPYKCKSCCIISLLMFSRFYGATILLIWM